MPNQATYRYDVFISYSSQDRPWVRAELMPRLEAAGLRVAIDFRDFQPGAPSVTEMERAILTSRRTVLVLSPAYLASAWGEFEQLMLQTLDPASRERRLIPLLKAASDLPLRLRYLTYINLATAEDEAFAWQQLLSALDAPLNEPPPLQKDAPPATADAPDLPALRQALIARTSLEDLKDICFIMNIDSQNYPADKQGMIRELLADLARKGLVEQFVQTVQKEKPWVLR